MELVGPVVEPALRVASEDLVELRLADQEGVVGANRLAVVVGEVQAHIVGRFQLQNGPKRVAGGRPRISARKRAASSLSRTRTMW